MDDGESSAPSGTRQAPEADRPTFLQRSRRKARKRLHQLDHEQVRRARGLMRALRHGQPDVLYLGDSVMSYVSAQDKDQRRLRVNGGRTHSGPDTSDPVR